MEDRESNGSESELVHLLRFLQAETACFKEAALAVSLQDAIRLCTPIPDPMYVVRICACTVYSYRFMGTRTYGISTVYTSTLHSLFIICFNTVHLY